MTTHWFSPFPLPEAILWQLEQRGTLAWDGKGQPPEGLHLIYLPPHAVLEDPQVLLSHYQQIQAMAPQGVLQRAEDLCGGDAGAVRAELITPRPVLALVTLAMLRERPAILDAYLDLELQRELGDRLPDSDYLLRLRQACRLAPLLQELDNNAIRQRASQLQHSFHQQQVQRLEQELSDSRLTINRSLEQQQELNHACRTLSQAAEESAQREAALRHQLAALQSERVALAADNGQLQERLSRLEASLQQLRRSEADALTRCQNLEDELERCDQERTELERVEQAGAALAAAQQQQIGRASQLLRKLSSRDELISASGQQSIQVLALLEGYRHSLKRAERLLLGRGG